MLSSVYGQIGTPDVLFYDSVVKIIITLIFIAICIPIGILIYKGFKKGKISKCEKNDSKISSNESKKDKNFLDTIQERLAKGEISLEEFNELKKELSS